MPLLRSFRRRGRHSFIRFTAYKLTKGDKMPVPEHEDLPDEMKEIAETQLKPYQLSEPQLRAVQSVCEQIYNIAILKGYRLGIIDVHAAICSSREEVDRLVRERKIPP